MARLLPAIGPLLPMLVGGCVFTLPPAEPDTEPTAAAPHGVRASIEHWDTYDAPPDPCRLSPPLPGAYGVRAAFEQWITYKAPLPPCRRPLMLARPEPRTMAFPTGSPRPRPVGLVDVDFTSADMSTALRFLAKAGRFNLVLGEGVTGRVSAQLRGADPFDALVALAEAHGAEVAYQRRVVIVRRLDR